MKRFLLISSVLFFVQSWTVLGGGLIHIDDGDQQLFLDEYLIESMTGAQQVLNPSVKFPGNPILRQDRPWEGESITYRALIYDDKLQQFRLWYLTSVPIDTDGDGKADNETSKRNCYAISKDGYHWEKPSLGLVEFQGSTNNNILKPENYPLKKFGTTTEPGRFKGGIFIDSRENDASKRYKGGNPKPLSINRALFSIPKRMTA